MTHVRRQIRDRVIDTEMIHFKNAGFLVTSRRVSSLESDELPAILVAVGDPNEESAPVTMGDPPVLERTAVLRISGIVKEEEPYLDDTLEEIAATVESLVEQTHGGLAKSTLLTGTEKEFDALGETPVAAISLQFAVVYHTASNDPETPL